MGVEEDSAVASTSQYGKRLQWIKDREVKKSAIEKYLESRDEPLPEKHSVDRLEYAAKILSEEEFRDFKQQFRFAGSKSLNFFVITGISDKIKEVKQSVDDQFPTAEEVQGQTKEPFVADIREFDDRLYISCGHYVSKKTVDPNTGNPKRSMLSDEAVAVINQDKDLVHVRTADVPLARDICMNIADSVGININSDDVFYKPSFDEDFVDRLSERIGKIVNITVRVEEGDDRTAGSVKFTSEKDDTGEYKDLRNDNKVQEELSTGEMKRGYVELAQSNFSFEMNRKQSKIWFRSYEREERLGAVVDIIDNVLGESGGYPQQKLQGFGNVPE